MKMLFILCSMLLITFDFTLAVPTPCNQLPKEPIDLGTLYANNPLVVYRSTWSIFKCSVVAHVPPLLNDQSYSATAMFVRGPVAFNFRLILTHNTTWNATYCVDGTSAIYYNALVDFDSPNATYIVYSCGADGVSYKVVIGFGRTDTDEKKIEEFLKKHEIPGIINTSKGCDLLNDNCPFKSSQT
ncbi:hypothetical protein CHUAL_005123 [Chamberlinius hualienensis]